MLCGSNLTMNGIPPNRLELPSPLRTISPSPLRHLESNTEDVMASTYTRTPLSSTLAHDGRGNILNEDTIYPSKFVVTSPSLPNMRSATVQDLPWNIRRGPLSLRSSLSGSSYSHHTHAGSDIGVGEEATMQPSRWRL